jgi:CrcB protein
MSSFALETTDLIDSRQFYTTAINTLSNVGLSIGAVYAGRIIASTIMLQL